jgi:radical SAM superfamily enzyme YgiQ (UPF0313 family)
MHLRFTQLQARLACPKDRTMRVGCVQINTEFSGQCYLPYSVGILQTYAQRHLPDPQKYEFLLPVFRRDRVADAVEHLKSADIAGFSLYSWNERLTMAIAERLKRLRPSTLIVCGGPQVPRSDRPWEVQAFHERYPFVDLAVHGAGEHAFVEILKSGRDGKWESLPSVSFLDGRGKVVQTEWSPAFKDLSEVPEPYLEGVFDPLIAEHPTLRWIGTEETNRNCPFKCTFCGWGLLGSKPVLRPIEDVLRTIDWFGEHRIGYIFVVDANFGMFKERDVTIARYFAKVKRERGFPRSVNVQDGKNIEEWVLRVRKELFAGGIDSPVVLALQSLHPPTLQAIKRSNIKTEPYRKQLQVYSREGIPTTTDIILGLPEETYESFTEGISTIIEWGQHNRSLLLNVSMVPDAEMSHPDQRKDHGIETVWTRLVSPHGRLDVEEFPEMQELVIGTRAMPRDAWVKTRAFAYMTSLLHFDKLLQIPLVICHEVGRTWANGAQVRPRYKDLIGLFTSLDLDEESFPCITKSRDFFVSHARTIQKGEDEYCYSREWLDIYWPPDEYMFITLVRGGDVEKFYDEAARLLLDFVEIDEQVLRQALALNLALLELPFRCGEHVVECGWNILEIYRAALKAEHVNLKQGNYEYPVNWSKSHWSSWDEWLEKVVWWRNRAGQYYLKDGIPAETVDAPKLESSEEAPITIETMESPAINAAPLRLFKGRDQIEPARDKREPGSVAPESLPAGHYY